MEQDANQHSLKLIIKLVLVVCVLAAIATVILILVHLAYSVSEPYVLFETKWSAGDLLSYAGMFAAAGIAYFGVRLTIESTRDMHDASMRLQVAPCIALTKLQIDAATSCDEMVAARQESGVRNFDNYQIDTIYFNVSQELRAVYDLKRDHHASACSEHHEVRDASGTRQFINNLFCDWYSFQNVGGGAAINLHCSLKRDDDSRFDGVTIGVLPNGRSMYLGINADALYSPGSYTLVYEYSDILGNLYEQQFAVKLKRFPSEKLLFSVATVDLAISRLRFDTRKRKWIPDFDRSPQQCRLWSKGQSLGKPFIKE